ncbi:hypothetical protein M422DRAFT_193118 [Sphaerobolus stellatus SS14]|uniref:Uncharacterized protein n=1 Tax=Sphaerobolus stellatus (strain SS14) TaxID=990650 RepID=A0A0C9UKC3_SPHS4|nr:hypothetical protein M422DRAFT_193118 [Sphaerobolus stellatus SS14]
MQQQQALVGQGERYQLHEGDVDEVEEEQDGGQDGAQADTDPEAANQEASNATTVITESNTTTLATTTATLIPPQPPAPPPPVTPVISIELRLRWLEALLLGVKQEINTRESQPKRRNGGKKETQKEKRVTLSRRAEELQRRLDSVVSSHEGLKKFMERYDQYTEFLAPSFALSGTTPEEFPSYSQMSSTELDALLSEMEIDIRAADRDMREIEALKKRGVVGAEKLADHEELKPRLEALSAAHDQDLAKAKELENRIANLLERHATKVDALSDLFVAWNDVITEAEDKVMRAEKEKKEKRRLGYE